ncbi:MAG: hypothetical protein KDC95_21900 [Planctomycetes bacterium]|nr:hypothetical protein [Planctomycetota bacterium]
MHASILFGSSPVNRSTYWKYGVALAALKLAVDAAVSWLVHGVVHNPLPFGASVLFGQDSSVVGGENAFR